MKVSLFCIALVASVCVACSTVPPAEQLTMQEAELNLSSLKRDEYVILGRITGEATVSASTSALKNDVKKSLSAEQTLYTTKIDGDTGTYGFIGDTATSNMTVTEKAVAMATYNLLNIAKYNQADAVLYVTRQLLTTENGSKTIITAKVSGIAVQLKADEGIVIKYPVKKVKEPKPAANTENAEETEETTEAVPAEEAESEQEETTENAEEATVPEEKAPDAE